MTINYWVHTMLSVDRLFLCKRHATKLDEAYRDLVKSGYMLNAMIELTMSLSFSFKALTAFFLDTLACCMTSSMSLLSRPVSSTSSPSSSSSSSFLVSPVSMALPLPWSWPACSAASLAASC